MKRHNYVSTYTIYNQTPSSHHILKKPPIQQIVRLFKIQFTNQTKATLPISKVKTLMGNKNTIKNLTTISKRTLDVRNNVRKHIPQMICQNFYQNLIESCN
eukprot:TRINITY_DN73955_c0_g1_i1.p1 TRINITY_DN73955_c0_g1~~TRINITY_DN73955_c0_g1_i1.p1  ORF type:complete len:101 (+),score=2.30 TRINITY_DN73955_c0_g1_i1:65-367(+)